MVQQKKNASGETLNGTGRREQSSMAFQRKEPADARVVAGHTGKADNRAPNGTRSFQTDATISKSRIGGERQLKRWVPDANDEIDGGLGNTSSLKDWDQFAEHEKRFGATTDYNENIYTTPLPDKSHPQYRERMALADRKVQEIERSAPATAHVAEERVMDFAGGDDAMDEEDKYSGVRRQDFPPLSGRENKYTPPARRAPTGQATVKGAPVDPAIISAQLKTTSLKTSTSKAEEPRSQSPAVKTPVTPAPEIKTSEPKVEVKVEAQVPDSKPSDTKPEAAKAPETKSNEKALRAPATSSRTVSPKPNTGVAGAAGAAVPSATSTVVRDVLQAFNKFATKERLTVTHARTQKIKQDTQAKISELKKFSESFKLSTPVPVDLVSIIAKDPAKQKAIQEKALQNAREVERQKEVQASAGSKDKDRDVTSAKEKQVKTPIEPSTTGPMLPESRNNARPIGTQHSSSPAGLGNRHNGPRNNYANQQYGYGNRPNGRGPGHMATAPNQATGNLASRIREQQKMHGMQHAHMGHHMPSNDMRMAPTGPANADVSYGRRSSGLPGQGHLAPRLNPNSHEFRPNANAPAFNPAGPSQGSSPRSSINVADSNRLHTPTPMGGQLIRRKTKAVDPTKCCILTHMESLKPPPGRSWDDNDGFKPAWDTMPTWRQLQEDTEKPDSTMHMTYEEYFEKNPFLGAAVATPVATPVIPMGAHQHQLPFHLQHGGPHMAPRQSPHMPPMQMHTAQHGPMHQVPFAGPDDHRMMHSASAQSYTASPRIGNMNLGYGGGGGGPPNGPGQVPYHAGPIQPFMPSTPQMNTYRSFSNNPQFVPHQSPHFGTPVMMQQHFVPSSGMMPNGPQMHMFPAGGHPQFMAPGSGPPPAMPGSNGFPSPGRPAAPMMAHQGSHQGQPVYGMSPNLHYQQPSFGGHQPQGKYSGPRPQ